ncbi:MAG: PAS domain S-box protein [Deltaproteobacteria bacterium]
MENRIRVLEEAVAEAGRLQAALQESEETFRVLAESTPTAVLLYQDNRWIYSNPAAEMITGYGAAEFLGMNFWDIVHPDYRTLIQERGRRRQRGEETVNRYEFKIITKGGGEKWVDLAGASTIIGGRPAGVLSVFDITDRKQAEEELRKSQEKYRLLTETLSDVIFTTDENLRITYINQAVTRLRGYSVEEAMAQSIEDILTPASLETALNSFAEEMRLEADGLLDPDRILTLHLEATCKDGSTVWTETIFKPIRNEEDGFAGVLAVTRDISDRKRTEEALRKSEEKYRLLTESLADVIFTLDENLRTTYLSPSVTRLRGYTLEEAMAQSLEDILTPASLEMARAALAGMGVEARGSHDPHRVCTLELEETCKDGSTVWTESIFSALRDKDNKFVGFQGITRDITERKKATEERERLIAERQKALSEIKVLSGMLPICSYCKKIRNDEGYWEHLENYISDRSGAEFTSGMCPDCSKKFIQKVHELK